MFVDGYWDIYVRVDSDKVPFMIRYENMIDEKKKGSKMVTSCGLFSWYLVQLVLFLSVLLCVALPVSRSSVVFLL